MTDFIVLVVLYGVSTWLWYLRGKQVGRDEAIQRVAENMPDILRAIDESGKEQQ